MKNNVFENIFNMVMDVKEKTKDNIKARIDTTLFCHCKNMELIYIGLQVAKFKANLTLDKNA
jgi:hypothetical protein